MFEPIGIVPLSFHLNTHFCHAADQCRLQSVPRKVSICGISASRMSEHVVAMIFHLFEAQRGVISKHRECLNQYYDKIEESCGSDFMLDARIHLSEWSLYTSIDGPSRSSLACLDVQTARFTMNIHLGFMCIPYSKLASALDSSNTCGKEIDNRKSTVKGCQDKCAWKALDFRCKLGAQGMKRTQELILIMDNMYGTNGSLYWNIQECDQFQTALTCNGTFETTSPAEEFHFPTGKILTMNAGTFIQPLFGMLLVTFLIVLQ